MILCITLFNIFQFDCEITEKKSFRKIFSFFYDKKYNIESILQCLVEKM